MARPFLNRLPAGVASMLPLRLAVKRSLSLPRLARNVQRSARGPGSRNGNGPRRPDPACEAVAFSSHAYSFLQAQLFCLPQRFVSAAGAAVAVEVGNFTTA